jgi:hypothetical protein
VARLVELQLRFQASETFSPGTLMGRLSPAACSLSFTPSSLSWWSLTAASMLSAPSFASFSVDAVAVSMPLATSPATALTTAPILPLGIRSPVP